MDANKNIIIIVCIVAIIWMGFNIRTKNNNIEDLENTVARLRHAVSSYSYALDEANNNIEEANSSIEDAQGYAWSSYDEMGWALDNLETVDTVSNP